MPPKKYFQSIKQAVGDQLDIRDLPDLDRKDPKPQKEQESKSEEKSKSGTKQLKERPKSQSSEQEEKKPSAKEPEEDKEEASAPSSSKKRPAQKTSIANGHQKIYFNHKDDASAYDHIMKTYKEDYFQPDIIEKAVSRNKRARKPAKGIWGIIKSFIPRITVKND